MIFLRGMPPTASVFFNSPLTPNKTPFSSNRVTTHTGQDPKAPFEMHVLSEDPEKLKNPRFKCLRTTFSETIFGT